MMREQEDQQRRLLYELCALAFSVLRSPRSDPLSPALPRRSLSSAAGWPPVSPVGLASLLVGMSLALMLCGSVTFVIGFVLMPWVIGLVMVFYLVGLVSSLSVLGRSILWPAPAPARSTLKEITGSLFSKRPII